MKNVLTRAQARLTENDFKEKNKTTEQALIDIAAAKFFDILKSKIKKADKILIVAGKGNNGGDGRALHKILVKEGYDCSLLDAENYTRDFQFEGFDVIVDALFGIGLNADMSGKSLEIIERINETKAYKAAVDIPSGLDADSGLLRPTALNAALTVTFTALKPGLLLNDGRDCAGETVVADIGIPLPKNDYIQLFEPCDFVVHERKINSHKGDYGKVKIIAGSAEMPGAAVLSLSAARACLKSGAGLVTLAVPKSLAQSYISGTTENTLYFLSDKGGKIVFKEEEAEGLAGNAQAVAIGMGLGKNAEIFKFLKYLIKTDIKLIVDADALNALSADVSVLNDKGRRAKILLTPHAVEFCRLAKLTPEELNKDPIGRAEKFAKAHNCAIILKGATSVITDGEKTVLNISGTPALAKGGSGDVLSGIVSAFTCRFDLLTAAAYSCYLLGAAAERAEKIKGRNSLLATELIDNIIF